MKIQVFALLKDYFKTEFELTENLPTIDLLKAHLSTMEPAVKHLLDKCRFAVNDEFVTNDYALTSHETVCIIPPSSGG